MIRVENLTRRFGRTLAVDDVSFSIEKGEIVGLLGPNGAGKTTIMRVLSCFIPPTRGAVSINNFSVVRDSLEIRRLTGYMPENVPLYQEMRVRAYLHFRAKLKGLSGMKRRDRVNAVLEQCGLEDVSMTVIGRLSKGYKQRVGLADTLVHEPEVLILDEPTIGLDPNQIRNVRSLIKSLASRHTVLLSTHILPEAEMLCSRVLIMHKGRIVASDTPQHLVGLVKGNVYVEVEMAGPMDDIIRACRSFKGVLEVSGERRGEWNRLVVECEKDSDIRTDLSGMAFKNGWPLRELKCSREKKLEDVFVEMTRERDNP